MNHLSVLNYNSSPFARWAFDDWGFSVNYSAISTTALMLLWILYAYAGFFSGFFASLYQKDRWLTIVTILVVLPMLLVVSTSSTSDLTAAMNLCVGAMTAGVLGFVGLGIGWLTRKHEERRNRWNYC